jgi:hypothetical protein
MRKIELLKYRGNASSLFTGRPQGEQAREELELDKIDKDKTVTVQFIIPSGTSSFNPSFYLGLLFNSIKTLGENFEKKYTFTIEDKNEDVQKVLQANLNDGKRNALNTISGKTGLGRFLTL